MDIHKESRDVVSDSNYMQLVRGMISYACLQRAMNVNYSNRGFVSNFSQDDDHTVPRGPAAFRCGGTSGLSFDSVEGADELREVAPLRAKLRG